MEIAIFIFFALVAGVIAFAEKTRIGGKLFTYLIKKFVGINVAELED